MNTNLSFTRNSPLRSVLVDDSTGRPLYKLETPRNLTNNTTRIWKFSPTEDIDIEGLLTSGCDCSDSTSSTNPGTSSDSAHPPVKKDDTEGNQDDIEIMFDELDGGADNEIARIHWRWLSSPRVVFRGKIADKKELMKTSGRGYTFSAGDKKFKWDLGKFSGVASPKLLLDDGSKTVIAQFHSRPALTRKKPHLEVTPTGMEILDYVILTWIFAEHTRRNRDKGWM